MQVFNKDELKKLYQPERNSSGEDNGQVTIIGGSSLFHGAPLFSLRVASRVVDMVFFASPHEPMREVSAYLKASLLAFIWVPWDEVSSYIEKSDALLVGPGFMRAASEESNHNGDRDETYELTRKTTETLLKKYSNKKWVIDAGSLQTLEPAWIPENAILTPNQKEYGILFGNTDPREAAKKHKCIIVLKGPVTHVYSATACYEVHGGNAGMTKGGTGDTMAGLTAALLAKNDPLLAASAAAFITKAAGDDLFAEQGVYYSADDLSEQIPKTLYGLLV